MFRNPAKALAVYIPSNTFRHRHVLSTRKKKLFILQFIFGEFPLTLVASIMETAEIALIVAI